MEAVLKCAGQGFAMAAGLTLAAGLMVRAAARPKAEPPAAAPRFARLRGAYRRRTALVAGGFFFLCWLPYLVAFYPGTVIYDMCVIVRQFFGLQPLTTWHCPFTTLYFGGCVWLGRLLGSDNYGTLLYMVLQAALMAYAAGFAVHTLRRLGAGRAWQAAALVFFGFVPIWGCYVMMIGKDTYYTATLLLFAMQTVLLAHGGRRAMPRARDLVAYGLTALFACLWRNNGLYVVLPTALCAVLLLARGRQRLRVGLALGAALAAAVLFLQVAVPAMGFVDDSASGLYSVAFQQTARTVRDHGAKLSEDEKAEIDRVLDLATIGQKYEPWISDPVKDTFRLYGQGGDAERAALARYRAVWLSMMRKYPLTYVQAFMAGNSGYYAFTPKYDGITYHQQAGLRFVFINYWEDGPGELHTTQPEALEPLRDLMMGLANRWWTLPLLSWLYVLPFYTWLMVAVGVALARQRRWRALVTLLPALLSFGVCLLSPVDSYLRYFLPIVAMAIPLAALAAHPPMAHRITPAAAMKGQGAVPLAGLGAEPQSFTP
jgi:hypothetical protein